MYAPNAAYPSYALSDPSQVLFSPILQSRLEFYHAPVREASALSKHSHVCGPVIVASWLCIHALRIKLSHL